MWLCALSSWRRLDSWGVETGEICDNTVARGGSFVSWYDCIMVSWYGCSLSKTLVGSCIAFFPKAAAKGSLKKSAVIKHCYQTLPKVLLK